MCVYKKGKSVVNIHFPTFFVNLQGTEILFYWLLSDPIFSHIVNVSCFWSSSQNYLTSICQVKKVLVVKRCHAEFMSCARWCFYPHCQTQTLKSVPNLILLQNTDNSSKSKAWNFDWGTKCQRRGANCRDPLQRKNNVWTHLFTTTLKELS